MGYLIFPLFPPPPAGQVQSSQVKQVGCCLVLSWPVEYLQSSDVRKGRVGEGTAVGRSCVQKEHP